MRRVVVGCLDPNPRVAGEGVRQLRAAGIEVEVGICGDACRQLIAPFETFLNRQRPYVTLKWAQSRDGKVAGRRGVPVRITNEAATAAVHRLRGLCDAIAVGTNTVRNDDPLLTARVPNPPRRPLRIVLSNRPVFAEARRLFATPEQGPVVLFTGEEAAVDSLADHVEVVRLPIVDNGRGEHRFAFSDVLRDLHGRGVTHLLVEPGPKLARDLIARGEVDRVLRFTGQEAVGDAGLDAPACAWPTRARVSIEGDLLEEMPNPASPAAEASADVLKMADGRKIDYATDPPQEEPLPAVQP